MNFIQEVKGNILLLSNDYTKEDEGSDPIMLKQIYQQKKADKQASTVAKLRGNQGLRKLAKARRLSLG